MAVWLVYQAEAVYTKTVCLGSCAKIVFIILLHVDTLTPWDYNLSAIMT